MSKKIYDETITVDQDLDKALKRAFVNSLLIYNHCLSLLYKNPELSFHVLRRQAAKYIDETKTLPYCHSCSLITKSIISIRSFVRTFV